MKAAIPKLQDVYLKAISAYSQRSNVTGIDIGYKYSGLGDRRTKQISVRIHVDRKISVSELEATEVFPKEIGGIPIDVIEADYKTHAVATPPARLSAAATIQPGVSVAHFKRSAGTIGLIVYDNVTRRPCLLSNWHVLVGKLPARIGDPILQPGVSDGGELLRHKVATLERYILDQNGDAAIASLTNSRPFQPNQLGSGIVVSRARTPQLGEVLEKSGRTTGITQALVDGIGRYFVRYGTERVGIDGFKLVSVQDGNPGNQEISAKGDSGSCWYDPASAEGVGLHFAGETDANPRAEYALACFLPRVLEALNVSLGLLALEQPNEAEAVPVPSVAVSSAA
jgi:hypothetical protein